MFASKQKVSTLGQAWSYVPVISVFGKEKQKNSFRPAYYIVRLNFQSHTNKKEKIIPLFHTFWSTKTYLPKRSAM